MWTQSTSVTRTNGRTDGQTDRITITDTVQRIASHGKNSIMDNSGVNPNLFWPFWGTKYFPSHGGDEGPKSEARQWG